MNTSTTPTKDIIAFSYAVNLLRNFFLARGFVEVHTQDRLSILAACEDPTTVATYEYEGAVWPLPQTGQMWLEYELLNIQKEVKSGKEKTTKEVKCIPLTSISDLSEGETEKETAAGLGVFDKK